MHIDIVSALIGGIALLLATLIGGWLQRRVRQEGADLADARHTIDRLTKQCRSFYELERLYQAELAALTDGSASGEGIKRRMRQRVVDDGRLARIQLSPSEIDRLRARWQLDV